MINNRQAGRRNRGRNNGRPNTNRGGGDNGNRIDNRARGNAPQLLEKYRNMARDAQLAGDRVNAEYYLQFADHYFRVLADNRLRQEEQQQRYRPQDDGYEDMGEQSFEDSSDAGESYDGDNTENARPHYNQRQDNQRPERTDRRDNRRDQNNRRESRPRDDQPRGDESYYNDDQVAAPVNVAPHVEDEVQPVAPRRRGRPPRATTEDRDAPAIDVAALPPSIGRSETESEPAADEAPRKRGRRPRATSAEAAE